MTNQEAFDKCLTEIRAQGRPSVAKKYNDDFGTGWKCMYRSPDGCKCAAGVFIDDDEYSSDLEGEAAYFEGGKVKEILVKKGLVDRKLVNGLQYAHDDAATDEEDNLNDNFLEVFNTNMKKLAFEEGLAYHD